MIRWCVANAIERFARHRDDVWLANFQGMGGVDVEGKLLRRPAKHNLPNLTPLWPNWNLGANSSHAAAVGILKCDVNIAVCLDFCINNAASKRVPFLFGRHSLFRRAGHFHIRRSRPPKFKK